MGKQLTRCCREEGKEEEKGVGYDDKRDQRREDKQRKEEDKMYRSIETHSYEQG